MARLRAGEPVASSKARKTPSRVRKAAAAKDKKDEEEERKKEAAQTHRLEAIDQRQNNRFNGESISQARLVHLK